MPFIQPDRRETLLEGTLKPAVPGDTCFLYYKKMVDEFKLNRRWSTAHEITKRVMDYMPNDPDDGTAMLLAWQVFFNLHVMPYEIEKQKENGDI